MHENPENWEASFRQFRYQINLLKHENGRQYIEISQIKGEMATELKIIQFHPTLLAEIIDRLKDLQDKYLMTERKGKNLISEADAERITTHYLKGVSIRDLAVQTGKQVKDISMMLQNRGIAIVSNEVPKWLRPKAKRFRKRK